MLTIRHSISPRSRGLCRCRQGVHSSLQATCTVEYSPVDLKVAKGCLRKSLLFQQQRIVVHWRCVWSRPTALTHSLLNAFGLMSVQCITTMPHYQAHAAIRIEVFPAILNTRHSMCTGSEGPGIGKASWLGWLGKEHQGIATRESIMARKCAPVDLKP